MNAQLTIDPAYSKSGIDIFGQRISKDIWQDKYRFGEELGSNDTFKRVADAVYINDLEDLKHKEAAFEAMRLGLWLPAGRISAGAGTSNKVTLMNCFVMNTIPDSLDGIADVLKESMLTMQQGGGIGLDFSTLRPVKAYLKRTGAIASGPLPFMDMWDAMCKTIMSAGSRRGAMMAVMRCDHPDIVKFIEAKHEASRLRMFNMSVLITDKFMEAVKNDHDWHLVHEAPVHEGQAKWDHKYVYETISARKLWNSILQSTYEYSEPGVIFIDRINQENNLNYCETISATNPCGEQPLPPYGACLLGHINLARLVLNPFQADPKINYAALKKVVAIGVRFCDNVIDISNYPLKEQKIEMLNKRRIGIGMTGLANMLQQLKLPYGCPSALSTVEAISKIIAICAYETSALLAREKSTFPLYDKAILAAPFVRKICAAETNLNYLINTYGLRNGVLLSVAPVGTGSIWFGNASSGLEPVLGHTVRRKVLMPDDTYEEYIAHDYGYQLYQNLLGPKTVVDMPSYMVTVKDLTIDDHLNTQARVQKWVDASISKTINVPEETTFEDFEKVYLRAFKLGCKGCTTYRPSEVRGSVIEDISLIVTRDPIKEIHDVRINDEPIPEEAILKVETTIGIAVEPRPQTLSGKTYKIKWASTDDSFYVTINNHNDKPFEIFISSKSSAYSEWTTALALLLTSNMRQGADIGYIIQELKQVKSANDSGWIEGKHYSSIVAVIGHLLETHVNAPTPVGDLLSREDTPGHIERQRQHQMCPSCKEYAVIYSEGCKKCTSCGYSTCG